MITYLINLCMNQLSNSKPPVKIPVKIPNKTFVKSTKYNYDDIVSSNIDMLYSIIDSLAKVPLSEENKTFKEFYNELQELHKTTKHIRKSDIEILKLRDFLLDHLQERFSYLIKKLVSVTIGNDRTKIEPVPTVYLAQGSLYNSKPGLFVSPYPKMLGLGSSGSTKTDYDTKSNTYYITVALDFRLPYLEFTGIFLHELTHFIQHIEKDNRFHKSKAPIMTDRKMTETERIKAWQQADSEKNAELNRVIYSRLGPEFLKKLASNYKNKVNQEKLLSTSKIDIAKWVSQELFNMVKIDPEITEDLLTDWDDTLAKETINQWVYDNQKEVISLILKFLTN